MENALISHGLWTTSNTLWEPLWTTTARRELRSSIVRNDGVAGATLEPLWQQLVSYAEAFVDTHRERLGARFPPGVMSDSDLLSFELGAYLRRPGDGSRFQPYSQSPVDGYPDAYTGVDGEHFVVVESGAIVPHDSAASDGRTAEGDSAMGCSG